ncbi:hypothetical protein ACQP2P_30830 [Dactylosporangium sp. CA-139114]|uniref:hypothetical protein n=1 Tax=Dactylosporangium sp. CA-139114 TaxID=3239931 RepID=UPI003D95A38F
MPTLPRLRSRMLAFAAAAALALVLGAGPVAVLALVFCAVAIPAAVLMSGGVPQVRALCRPRSAESPKARA